MLWSIQEQRQKTLKATESLEQLSTSTTITSPSKEVDTFFPAQYEPTPVTRTESQSTKPSVAALTAIIHNLTTEQRQKLDITIQVLTRRLQDILSQKPPVARK